MVRGRFFGARLAGSPGSSQNIWARVITVLILPSTYKTGVGFVIIALLLLLRPHGLLGTPEIKK